MDQLTDQEKSWLINRLQGIGSSDAPIVMGVSPWMTPFQLWEEKTKRVSPFKEKNWAQERGNRMEPAARSHYELLNDMEMEARLLVHPKYKFIMASLDGYNEENKRILEIKCPGEADHAKAVEGELPTKYIYQVQHQILVAGLDHTVDYYSFDGTTGVRVLVGPDKELIEMLLYCEIKFWELVQRDVPPEFVDGDFKKVRFQGAKKLITKWKEINGEIAKLTVELMKIQDEIMTKIEHPRAMIEDVRIYKEPMMFEVKKGAS